MFAQFLSALMLKDYETALKYCKLSKFYDLSAIFFFKKLNSKNACYHLVQDFLSSCVIFKYISSHTEL
jgi:hypothetical protein